MAKILVSGISNSGKTSLLKPLENVLIIANDGKTYPFEQPHVNVAEINTAEEFIDIVSDGMEKYKSKFEEYPSTIVIDSISKTWLDIEAHYLKTIASFPYGPINKDISIVMSFLENELAKNGFNIIFVSHAFKDELNMALVNAGGSWGSKKGGVLAHVNNAIYIELKGKKRQVLLKDHKLARTLQELDNDCLPVEEFNLQKYLDDLIRSEVKVDKWSL
jgi:hypothetical protein